MAAITALRNRTGEPRKLADVDGIGPDSAEALQARGQHVCCVADRFDALLGDCLAATLSAAPVEAATIDRVLVTSESIMIAGSKSGHEARRAELHQRLAALGLGAAPVQLFTFSGCSSAVTALEYASLLVDARAARAVLVLAADHVPPGEPRVLGKAVSVVGDGAAAGVVVPDGLGNGLRLRWCRRRAFLEAARHDRTNDFTPALVMLGRSLGTLGDELRDSAGIDPAAPLLCNNYGLPTVELFAQTLGIPLERVSRRNAADIGHVGSPDVLINLETEASREHGAVVLATGPVDCSLAYFVPAGP